MGVEDGGVPFIRRIFHPTDFSPESEAAFVHALAICLFRQGELTILHAGKEYLEGDEWQNFPAVRRTLERWKLLEPGSPAAAVFRKLGIRVNKISAVGDPLEAALDHLANEPADLIVLATEGREGLPRWVRQSTAEALARWAGIPTLFVPHGARGFVQRSGDLTLRRILVPVAAEPDPRAPLVYATRATLLAGGEPVELVALHVGEAFPEVELPAVEGATWRRELRRGEPEDEIVRAAQEQGADLVCMATAGPSGLVEVLRGSTTERILRRLPCCLCAVPAPAQRM
jgi:nucleotide-binding universal stress UspA family protein